MSFSKLTVLKNDNEIHSRYSTVQLLGSGFFARTYEVKDLKDSQNRRYAMKQQGKDPATLGSPGESSRLCKEVVFLNRILPKHPNIIEIKDVLASPNNLYIITELCAKGKNMTTFSREADNASGRRVFGQLLEAIHTCHEHGIAHSDLRGENILFKDEHYRQLKLIDFGLSSYRPEWARQTVKDFDYTRWFTAEELDDLPYDPRQADVSSLGWTLYNIISGTTDRPAGNSDRLRQLQNQYRPRTEIFDEAAMDLLSKIGPPPFGPDNRDEIPTLDEIRAHPWLTWRSTEPWYLPARQLGIGLAALRNDLNVLRRLLKEWMVMPLTPVQTEEEVSEYYIVVGRFQRGNEETRILDVELAANRNEKFEMRLIFGRLLGKPEVHPEGYETKDPLLLYIELVITLRILPVHEHLIYIKQIYINEKFVAIVRDRMEGHTMLHFFTFSARNSISRRVFRKLAQTVRFMHQHGVVHMDLHPQHIVWKTLSAYSYWSIVNFSKARFNPAIALYIHENFQPYKYFTAELYQLAGDANVQVDITALGRILHGMMSGVWEPDPAKCVNHFPRRDMFDEAAGDLLSKIGPEPFGPPARDRSITMEDICLHPWLQKE